MPDFLVEVTLSIKVRASGTTEAESLAVKIAQDYLLENGHTLYLGHVPNGNNHAQQDVR